MMAGLMVTESMEGTQTGPALRTVESRCRRVEMMVGPEATEGSRASVAVRRKRRVSQVEGGTTGALKAIGTAMEAMEVVQGQAGMGLAKATATATPEDMALLKRVTIGTVQTGMAGDCCDVGPFRSPEEDRKEVVVAEQDETGKGG